MKEKTIVPITSKKNDETLMFSFRRRTSYSIMEQKDE